jgi:hypothetical protein
VEKALSFLHAGIHLVVVDLFPPTPRDPLGIHQAIWDGIQEEPLEFPPQKNRTLVSYSAGEEITAFVEPVGVGDALPEMPLFLEPECHVPLALEAAYQQSWEVFPAPLKPELEGN